MVAKRFFYVCAGIFLLALAYHFGALNATAQVGSSNPVVAMVSGLNGYPSDWPAAVTANGDVYLNTSTNVWTHNSNIFSGPTPATQETWGGVKARYRQGGTAKQAQDK